MARPWVSELNNRYVLIYNKYFPKDSLYTDQDMFVCGRNPASASRKEKVKQQIVENTWLSRNNQINMCTSFDNDVGNCYHKDMKIRRVYSTLSRFRPC